jgi:ABC-type branched-subunit amino acid transport system substrate-binding protein
VVLRACRIAAARGVTRRPAIRAATLLTAVCLAAAGCASSGSTSSGSTSGSSSSVGTINIAMHMPISGGVFDYGSAGPQAANYYWRWLKAHGETIDGDNVNLTIADDAFNPSTATQVCTQFTTANNLLIIGFQGTPVITPCAAVASRAGIPYFSRGLDPSLATTNKTYFALSPTYEYEAPMVANWMEAHPNGKGNKVAFFGYNIAEINYTVDKFEAQAKADGLTVEPAARVSLTATTAEIQAAALKLKSEGVGSVYMDLAGPVVLGAMTTWKSAGYMPNIVDYADSSQVTSICKSIGSTAAKPAIYAPSPWPGADQAAKLDPNFAKAVAQYSGQPPTDIEAQFWGDMQLVAAFLKKVGPKNLTPAKLLVALQHDIKNVSTPLMGPVTYSPTNRIDATREYMLQANCQNDTLPTLTAITFPQS